MTPDPTPAHFYDDLAADYHLIFADWDAAIAWEADIITALLRDRGVTAGPVLDASCGIGTQAIGLARAGFAVTATDISPASVERCAREAAARGLTLTTAVADLRTLDVAGGGSFAAALSFDNALPHLLADADLDAACGALRRALRPSGILLASIRDYDAALRERPSGEPPRRYPTEDGERIVFQVWDWLSADRYTVRHFMMTGRPGEWSVSERRTTYRALTRVALTDALGRAGFEEAAWLMPEETGFYQPIVAASAGSGAGR
ncbi:MAG TPA: class I SAM-dependent methyltransferase [Gaiellales bacterium]|jgi:SAM-dependent methyltransferase|nr:class I SAM-dependent methyltransferase [Gaiellales bacterium]